MRVYRNVVFVVELLLLLGGADRLYAGVFPDPSMFGNPDRVSGIPGSVSDITVTPDGGTMVYCAFNSTWRLYTATRNPLTNVWGDTRALDFPSSYNECPSLSPDGRWLFYSDDTGSGRLMVAERDASGTWGNPREIRTNLQAPQSGFFDGRNLYVSESTWRTGDSGSYLWHELFSGVYDPTGTSPPELLPVASLTLPYPADFAGKQIVNNGNTMLAISTPDAFSARWDIFTTNRDATTGEWSTPQRPDWTIGGQGDAAGSPGAWFCEATQTMYFVKDYQLYESQVVPEPSTLVMWSLFGVCSAGCFAWRRIVSQKHSA